MEYSPLKTFMYHGDELGRSVYQSLAKTTPWKGILGMSDPAKFNPALGTIKNPVLNRLNYGLQGLTSLGKSFLGMSPQVSGNIGGGTLTGRLAYEKAVQGLTGIMNNPFVRGLGTAGAVLGAGQLGYGLGNLGMQLTDSEDDVAALGAMFNETALGQTLGEALLGYSTPQLNAITSMYANPNVQVDTTSNYQDRIQQVAAAEAAAAAAAAEEAATIRELAMSGQGGSDNRPVSSQTSSPLGGMLGASIHGGYNTPASPSPHAGSTFRTLSGSTSGGGTGSQGGNPHGGGGGGGLGPTGGMGGRFRGTSRF
jgi:hypothetical protein